MKILSEYHGDGSYRQALVYEENNHYCVRLLDREYMIVKTFNTEQQAEDCAEDWVRREIND